MAKADSKPNKGFIKEIAKTKPVVNSKKPFEWRQPIVKPVASSQATPYRMREFKEVRPAKSNLVVEQTTHIKNRREGKK